MVELKPHQRIAIDEMDNGKVLWGDVGVGKTLTALGYYVERESPRDIYVITTAKKRDTLDWQYDAAKFAIHDEKAVHGALKVDSWNNIGAYKDVTDAFFIFDEQRVVGSGAWVQSFIDIAKRNRWILLSATPGDNWLDYIPLFVANGFYKNRSEFKREHVVYSSWSKYPKVERYLGVAKLVKIKNWLLVEMPYERHTTRNYTDVHVDYDKELFKKVVKDKWHVYENRPLKNVAEMFLVMRKVVNSDPGRLRSLETLLASHPRLIVFYNFDYELDLLRKLTQPNSKKRTDDSHDSSEVSSTRCWKDTTEESVKHSSKAHSSSPASPGTSISGSTEIAGATDATRADELSSSRSTGAIALGAESSDPTRHPSESPRSVGTNLFIEANSKKQSATLIPEPGNSSSTTFEVAEWNGHKHEPIPETDRWVYLVQYAAGSEGWNCIETDAMVFYSQTYSYKHYHQAQGRIDRLNTPFEQLYYYTLKSKSFIDIAIAKSLSEKRNFNERSYAKTIGE